MLKDRQIHEYMVRQTCPVAMKMAVTMLAAWALNPPMEPAMAEPIRFLLMFRSTKASTLVFNTWNETRT